jgi:hypothetical protein
MTEREFDNGYWYATELRAFAVERRRIPCTKTSGRPNGRLTCL